MGHLTVEFTLDTGTVLSWIPVIGDNSWFSGDPGNREAAKRCEGGGNDDDDDDED